MIIMNLFAFILAIIVIIGAVIIGFMVADKLDWLLFNDAHGQTTNATPPTVSPQIVPTPTPTATSPNFQYLPQKAYVQPFAPEVGIPASSQPLTAVPTVVSAQIPVQQQSTAGGFDLMSIIATITGLAGVGYGHVAKKQAATATSLTKENMGAILNTKEVQEQLAKFTFQANPEKANALNDMPQIKLENLSKDKQEFADKAAQA